MEGTVLFFILTVFFGLQLIGIKKNWNDKYVSRLFLIISFSCFPFFFFSGIISLTSWWEIFHWYIDGVCAIGVGVLIFGWLLYCSCSKNQID